MYCNTYSNFTCKILKPILVEITEVDKLSKFKTLKSEGQSDSIAVDVCLVCG